MMRSAPHECCYHRCPRPATIHIGASGSPGAHWICPVHFHRWHADRDRFRADGLACAMQPLGTPPCWDCLTADRDPN